MIKNKITKIHLPKFSKRKITKVKKRDGTIVDFEPSKITDAIFKAITATGQGDGRRSKKLSDRVNKILNRRFKKDEIPQVEQIQDIVEEVLILEGLVETARAYILYREQRRRIREAVAVVDESSERIDKYLKELDWQVYENANMTFSLQGLNQYAIGNISKKYWLNKIYPKEIREAAANEDFHIHNLETIACYCMGWDLYDLLKRGFRGVPGKLECRSAKHLRTALGQLVNFFYTLQGESAGAQAVSNFDTLLAPFIRYDGLNYAQVKQAMQEFLYNCMVPTRVGFQSLCWDELVVIKEKGKIKFKEIGKLIDREFKKNSHRVIEKHVQSYAVENHDDYYVLSFDKNGKAIWAKVKAFVRHKVPKNSEFVKIRTTRGDVKVSKAHSLFSFPVFDRKFNPKPTSTLTVHPSSYTALDPKNHFIALNRLENRNKGKEKLDLTEIVDDFPVLGERALVKINPERTISQIKTNILKEYPTLDLFYIDNQLPPHIFKYGKKSQRIAYGVWKKFGNPNMDTWIAFRGSNKWFSRFLEGSNLRDFVKVCAWYITEGFADTKGFYIVQGEKKKQNVREITSALKKLNLFSFIKIQESHTRKGEPTQKVFKIRATGLLADLITFCCEIHSNKKTIPWFVYNLSPDLQKLFINTLLKGDGSKNSRYWDYITTSRKLSLGLSLLLTQNNYYFRIYSQPKGNRNWRDRYCIRIFRKKPIKRRYKVRDFGAYLCTNVEKFTYQKEYEYDISVDLPQENFIGGNGLLVFHNTPFLNVTLDIKPPSFLAKQPVIIGGQPQKETYEEFQEEMDMLIRAFYEGLMEGDAGGRPFTFPIPTVSITKDFDWNNPALDPLWEATAKYGVNYFQNFVKSDMNPEDYRSMCCRLRLSNKELYKRGGGLFGSAPLTGSIGVVTINMSRIGYLSKTKKEFFERLGYLMNLAKQSLEIKRKALDNFMEKGLYPYSKFYLASVKKIRNSYFGNHFSTIGLIGMNEAFLNFIGEDIGSRQGRRFAIEVLDFMRERLIKYQKETGYLYNLEATPGEGTSYRQAKSDKEKYPDIITAGTKEAPYYTNSSQLAVNYTDDVFDALKLQDDLQCKYTGGCIEKGNNVLTDKGLILIENIVNNFKELKPIKALSYNIEKKVSEWDEILEAVKIDVKKHDKIRIKGERNLDIVTSDWHPFFVLKRFKPNPSCPICEEKVGDIKSFAAHIRWNLECKEKYQEFPKYQVVEKRADELKVGDYILQNSFNLYPDKISELNEDLAWLIGFFIGDGCISEFIDNRGRNNLKSYKIRFFSEHQEALDKVVKILDKYFSAEVKVIQNDKRSNLLKEVSTSRKEILDFFFRYGFRSGKKAYSIFVSQKIKENLTKSNVFSFLAGLMDSDGHISKRDGEFEYYTVSTQLANDVLEIFTKAGITINKRKKPTKRKNEVDIWRLRIPSYEMTRIRKQLTNTINGLRIKEILSNRKKRHFPVVRVKQVSKVDVKDNQFYDLMTKRNHNYLAGKNTLVFIHNTVLHILLGEKISDIQTAKNLVRKVFEKFHLPYITLTPTFSICPAHGYLTGEHFFCPKCTIKQPCEVYSRVVGYLRPVQQWHVGKRQEFKERKEFKIKV